MGTKFLSKKVWKIENNAPWLLKQPVGRPPWRSSWPCVLFLGQKKRGSALAALPQP
jgi:hypothetical protein